MRIFLWEFICNWNFNLKIIIYSDNVGMHAGIIYVVGISPVKYFEKKNLIGILQCSFPDNPFLIQITHGVRHFYVVELGLHLATFTRILRQS